MNAYDRIILKTTALILGAMCLGILAATWVGAEEPPVLCRDDIRVPMEIEVTDERTCAFHGKTATPCMVQCGRVVIKAGCKRMTWRGCDGAQAVVPQPSPAPTRSPRPTAQPTSAVNVLCYTGAPAYCWAKGSRLSVGGSCWSNCTCILRGSGECAQ